MTIMSRRQFFQCTAITGTVLSVPCIAAPQGIITSLMGGTDDVPEPSPALYYKKLDHKKIECTLCPRACKVADLERGYCGVRENRDGLYYTLVHSRPCAMHVDPIEKKPFFHFLPASSALSIATAGCNMNCKFCQNWDISQVRPEQVRSYNVTPEQLVQLAKSKSCQSVSYTYSEPVIFYEYVLDTAKLTKKSGIKSTVVSNGYLQEEPLVQLCQYIDAMKVDLKAYTETFYKDICSATLKPVLETLKILVKHKIWTEIVYLVIPTLNDDKKNISEMCTWIMDNLGPDVPVHFSRYYPMYQLKNIPPTPVDTLETIWETAKKTGIHYVYVGNVRPHKGENTYCPKCDKIIIKRRGYFVEQIKIENGKCGYCNTPIAGVWT